jgi:hypothetical protein
MNVPDVNIKHLAKLFLFCEGIADDIESGWTNRTFCLQEMIVRLRQYKQPWNLHGTMMPQALTGVGAGRLFSVRGRSARFSDNLRGRNKRNPLGATRILSGLSLFCTLQVLLKLNHCGTFTPHVINATLLGTVLLGIGGGIAHGTEWQRYFPSLPGEGKLCRTMFDGATAIRAVGHWFCVLC